MNTPVTVHLEASDVAPAPAATATPATISSRHLEALAAGVPEPMFVVDSAATILLANQAAADAFGHPAADLQGRSVTMLLPEHLRRSHQTALRRCLARGMARGQRDIEVPGLRRDGTVIPLDVSLGQLELDGTRVFTCIARDISRRKEMERRLRESEERHALALRGANDGLWDWDLVSGRIVFSPRWATMAGVSPADLGDDPSAWFSRVLEEDLPRLQSDLRAHLERRTGHFQNEHRMRHADGSVRWMLARGLAVWDADGRASRIAGSQTDITEQKLAQQRLRQEVLHDHLTGLPNRAFFIDRLRQSLARARRRKTPFSLLYLDLDRFKEVNDTLGHPVGDELLVEVSRRMEACLGPHDSAARLGGDEFVILADGDVRHAEEIATRLQSELSRPCLLGEHEVPLAASIGIATWLPEHSRPEEIMRDADTALYRAKSAGKARHAVFDTSMRQRSPSRLEVETELRRALDTGEIQLAYQPVADIVSGRVVAFESLVRWQHPQRGELRPGDFLPHAEQAGLAEPLAAWILDHACEKLAHWRKQAGGELDVAINVSPRQVASNRCLEALMASMERHAFPAESLSLEIDETLLRDDLEAIARSLEPVRALGIKLTLDHFGSGWSSLRALQRLPFDCVKLDRSYLAEHVADSPRSPLRALARLAEDIGVTAVAMGVETGSQLDLVRDLGFRYAQGDYLAPALPEPVAEDFWHGARG